MCSSLKYSIWFCYRPVHGLIFLFKWVEDEEPDGPIVQDDRLKKIYFAKQVTNISMYILSLSIYHILCGSQRPLY